MKKTSTADHPTVKVKGVTYRPMVCPVCGKKGTFLYPVSRGAWQGHCQSCGHEEGFDRESEGRKG